MEGSPCSAKGSSGVLSDTGSMTEGKPNPDLEKSLREARLALKTGMSAYEMTISNWPSPCLLSLWMDLRRQGSTEDPDFSVSCQSGGHLLSFAPLLRSKRLLRKTLCWSAKKCR